MKTFYSTIKISPNTITEDSLSIGLLLYDGQKCWLKFSEDRKKIAKKLVGENAVVVDFVVKHLNSLIEKVNENLSGAEKELDILINSTYLNDLNNSSNGLLRFSKASFLDDVINEEKFKKLFELLLSNN